ncbi:hypothetical protein [Amorphus orientalis]|uniref:Orc1-like AAA ATPase domain-containing protein n=1 Tax=Amorphus orientalis TaxID=649198 RepID=A0AAE3VNI8_9HYPH|nr:hypothetical protein [Amorphus orientalis]MDQ0314946.1 hypothetical protein [Amorphus orientalis]
MSADLKFSGENRKASLQQLVRAFEDVKSEAEGVRANGVPKAPIHRVALIHGERGRGKTRLAIELYRQLRKQEDPAGYWPEFVPKDENQDQASLTPRAEDCDYEPVLPFLWWGIQAQAGYNPGNALFATLDKLKPHLVTMRIAHRRSQDGRSTAAELADVATELGMSVAELGLDVAGEVIGAGSLKRIAEGMWRIGKIGQERLRENADPAGEGDRHAASVSEEVLADLDRLLNPKSPQFAHRPAVILIDDAQFADQDRPLAVFVERLIVRSARGRWPLLILMTHWSRNLDDTETAAGEPVPRSLVAQVLDRVRQTPEPGPVWWRLPTPSKGCGRRTSPLRSASPPSG